jgi:hypothetical protein
MSPQILFYAVNTRAVELSTCQNRVRPSAFECFLVRICAASDLTTLCFLQFGNLIVNEIDICSLADEAGADACQGDR